MPKSVAILIWTTALTVVLLVWIKFNKPYFGEELSPEAKDPGRIELTTEFISRVRDIKR